MTLDTFSTQPQVGFRTECYTAVLYKFRRLYPKAHFEVVMRFPDTVGLANEPPSELSPSKDLLLKYKDHHISFEDLMAQLKKELFTNQRAVQRMKELRVLSRKKLVFLVCCEKDARQCHRSFLAHWIEHEFNM